MGIERFYGELMLEPLCLRPWEIAEMTDEQILMALAAAARRQRKLEGRDAFDPDQATPEEQYEQMRALGRCLGLSDADVAAQWNQSHPGLPMPAYPAERPLFRNEPPSVVEIPGRSLLTAGE